MNEYDFLVVGGGIAGLSAAYTAAKAGIKTLVLDEGDFALRTSQLCVVRKQLLEQIFADALKNLPVGRTVVERKLVFAQGENIFEIRRKHSKMQTAENALITLKRADFVDWLRKQAIDAGVEIQTNVKAIEPILEAANFVGVHTHSSQEYRALLTVIATDANSPVLEALGLPTAIEREKSAVLASEIFTLAQDDINHRFNLSSKQGSAQIFVGAAGELVLGYLHTLSDSIALTAIALPLGDGRQMTEDDALEALAKLKSCEPVSTFIDEAKSEGTVVEIKDCFPDRDLKRVYGQGVILAGNAANIKSVLQIEDCETELLSGKFASETAIECAKARRADKKFSGFYYQKLKESFLLKDAKAYDSLLTYLLGNPQIFTVYPAAIVDFSAYSMQRDESPLKKRNKKARENLFYDIGGFYNIIKDFWALRSRF